MESCSPAKVISSVNAGVETSTSFSSPAGGPSPIGGCSACASACASGVDSGKSEGSSKVELEIDVEVDADVSPAAPAVSSAVSVMAVSDE